MRDLFTDVFRFVVVRPTQKVSEIYKKRWFFSQDTKKIATEPIGTIETQPQFIPSFENLQHTSPSWSKTRRFARQFAASMKDVLDDPEYADPLGKLWQLFLDYTKNFINNDDLQDEITKILKTAYTAEQAPTTIKEFLAKVDTPSGHRQAYSDSLWDLLYALSIESNDMQPEREKSIQYVRAINVLKNIGNINTAKDLDTYRLATPLIPSTLYRSATKVIMNPIKIKEDFGEVFSEDFTFSTAYLRPLGFGDHKVVRQKIERYELGEIAYVENVMKSEYKERKYRTLDRTEQSYIYETETTSGSEKDLQSTERFELQKEIERTISTNLSLNAGVNISASYGPTVKVEAQTNFAMENAKSESDRIATNYSKEIVSKSVQKINERVMEARTSTTNHEVEETNTHGFDNKSSSDHVIGVYRWLDKIYKAQVINYGRRFMFEFIIPEPAAFYIEAHSKRAEINIDNPAAPKSLVRKDDKGNLLDLEISEIDETNYLHWVQQYNVTDVELPPQEFIETTILVPYPTKDNANLIFLTGDESRGVNISESVTVPPGYIPFEFSVVGPGAPGNGYNQSEDGAYWSVWVGNTGLSSSTSWKQKFYSEYGSETTHEVVDKLPIIVYGYKCWFVYLNITIKFQVSQAKINEWKYSTYMSIINAYQKLKADYYEQVARAEAENMSPIQGQTPDTNRSIEKQELKKSCIRLLRNELLNFDLVKPDNLIDDNIINKYPEIDMLALLGGAGEIQFLEQAFEWDEMTYLFYPYFWGRRDNWTKSLLINDTDPMFEKFLQAGASRVIVPVRLNYEFAVWHYLNTLELWGGGEGPVIDDELFISIAAELKEQADIVTPNMLTGEEWDVKIPTSLVYLQEDSNLPSNGN